MGSQYHFTMEPQTAFCFPNDDGGINVYCATQWFDLIQQTISRCLKLPHGKVLGGMKRIGGGYGAKVSRVAQMACACALACHLTRRPVRFVMSIEACMTIMGKRDSNAAEYEMTVDLHSGRIIDLSCSITKVFGFNLNDNSSVVIVETLKASCYARSSAWKFNIQNLKTDTAPTTWCRAPGTTEAIAMVENVMEHIARETNLDPATVRLNNLHSDESLHKIFPEFLKDTGTSKTRISNNKQKYDFKLYLPLRLLQKEI